MGAFIRWWRKRLLDCSTSDKTCFWSTRQSECFALWFNEIKRCYQSIFSSRYL